MPSIDVLTSEAKLLNLALKLKDKKLRRAAKLIEQAEAELDEAIAAIMERAGLDPSSVRGTPRLLHDMNGKPAKLIWPDAVRSAVNGSVAATQESTATKT